MGWECNLSLEVEVEFYVSWLCLRFLLHWKGAFEIGWHTSGWVRIEENSNWGLEVLGELGRMFFTACELENSQDEVDIRSACLVVHFPWSLDVSYPGALRKHWDPDLQKHVLLDSSAASARASRCRWRLPKLLKWSVGRGLGQSPSLL